MPFRTHHHKSKHNRKREHERRPILVAHLFLRDSISCLPHPDYTLGNAPVVARALGAPDPARIASDPVGIAAVEVAADEFELDGSGDLAVVHQVEIGFVGDDGAAAGLKEEVDSTCFAAVELGCGVVDGRVGYGSRRTWGRR